MNQLLEKISSYHLFNYLLPGVIFVILSKQITSYSFIQDDLILGFFVYYFIGLTISRVGSLIFEPLLKKISFVKFAKYTEFLVASKKDFQIEILSETNNMYRSLLSMTFLLLALKFYELISYHLQILQSDRIYILLLFLLIIFLTSYKKQTSYISKRISANN